MNSIPQEIRNTEEYRKLIINALIGAGFYKNYPYNQWKRVAQEAKVLEVRGLIQAHPNRDGPTYYTWWEHELDKLETSEIEKFYVLYS